MSGSFISSNQSIAVTIFHASRIIDFDGYTRQGSEKPYLKCDLCESFIFLRADGTSPKMIEHWERGKCQKTLGKLERQRANQLEVKLAEIVHDDAFGSHGEAEGGKRTFSVLSQTSTTAFRMPSYSKRM